jgi:hypothetical protein
MSRTYLFDRAAFHNLDPGHRGYLKTSDLCQQLCSYPDSKEDSKAVLVGLLFGFVYENMKIDTSERSRSLSRR